MAPRCRPGSTCMRDPPQARIRRRVPAVTADVSVLVVGGGPAGLHRRPAGPRARRAGHPAREGPGRRDQPQLRAGAGADAGAGGPAGAGLVVLGPVRPDRRRRPSPTYPPCSPTASEWPATPTRRRTWRATSAGTASTWSSISVPVGFTGPHTMAAGDGRTWTADRIILAVGGHAARLPIPGAELALTYEDIHSLTNLPGPGRGDRRRRHRLPDRVHLRRLRRRRHPVRGRPRPGPGGRRGRVGRAQPRLPRPGDDGGHRTPSSPACIGRTGSIYLDHRSGQALGQTAADAVFFAVGWPASIEG